MSKLTLLLIVAASAIALLVTGCGGDDSTAEGGDSSLSKAAFIKQGDAVCVKADKEKQAAIEEFLQESDLGPNKPLSDKEQEEMVTVAILPPISKAAEELTDLGAPDAQASAIIEGVEGVTEEAEANPAKLSTPKDDPFAGVAKQAKQYGFKACFLYY
jgi:hypothetical protein